MRSVALDARENPCARWGLQSLGRPDIGLFEKSQAGRRCETVLTGCSIFPQGDIAHCSAMGGEEIHEDWFTSVWGGESLRYKGPIQARFDALAPARR
jgi:hypothetical protein